MTRSNGDVLPTLLVDGYAAGVWRPVEAGIEATAFHRLRAEDWEGLATEARALTAFLADREPRPYRRYDLKWRRAAVWGCRRAPSENFWVPQVDRSEHPIVQKPSHPHDREEPRP